jgi:hypothetical protein
MEQNPLNQQAHRPWPLPARSWVMAQTWHDLLFAHWPLAPAYLEPFVPRGLRLDMYDSQAWLAVVPFRMSGVRLRWLPALGGCDAFPELNVRTYVTDGSQPGVLFLSLDAGNPLAVTVARRWFHLPYFRARMLQIDTDYSSYRTHSGAPPAALLARYAPVGPVFHAAPGTLEHWLTERYCLYTADPQGRLLRAQIHHSPWPLQPAVAEFFTNTMAAAHGLTLPDVPPLLHFARRLDVRAWTPEVVPSAC